MPPRDDGPSEGLDRPMLIDIYGPEIEDVMWEKAPFDPGVSHPAQDEET